MTAKPVFLLSLVLMLGGLFSGSALAQPSGLEVTQVSFSGEFRIKEGTRQGVLSLTADIQDGWHVFSITQQPGGPVKSQIDVEDSPDFWLIGNFHPNHEPHLVTYEYIEVASEEHEGSVTWSVPFEMPDDVDEQGLEIRMIYSGQTCETDGSCLPIDDVEVVAEFAGYDANLVINEEVIVESSGEVVAAEKKSEEGIIPDDPELVAQMAELYDVDEKIQYLNYNEMDYNPIGSGGTSSASNTTFWTGMIGAFLGGMLLNLMPCVFPVLGLKVMGFVMQSGNEASKIRMHGLAFTLGLVVSMWILGGTLMILRYGLGQGINWGDQMGNPYFVGAMIVLLFMLGLNMAGVFEIGTSMTSLGGGGQQKGYSGSFFSGILTTLIATPCSGPFLGVAMSYTLAQPIAIAMVLFTIFALGIAMPYLVMSFFPILIKMLPKPGPWMDTFKVLMAFALFGTVAFFMKVFGSQTGSEGLSWMVIALVIFGLAAYCYGKWGIPEVKNGNKRIAFGYALPILIFGTGFYLYFDAAGYQPPQLGSKSDRYGLPWQEWNPGKIKHSLANNGQIIWVDYTADW
ncbi:MAG: cytochrome c biogenesis protein CcdA [Planctomycetota bacterium]